VRCSELVTVTNLVHCSDKWCVSSEMDRNYYCHEFGPMFRQMEVGPGDGLNLLLSRIWPDVLTNGLPVPVMGQTVTVTNLARCSDQLFNGPG